MHSTYRKSLVAFHFAHTSGCYRHTLTLHTVCVIRSHTSLRFLLLYLLLSACLSSSVVKLRETQPARLRKHRRRLASIYSSISSHFVRTLTCNLISSLPNAGEFAPESASNYDGGAGDASSKQTENYGISQRVPAWLKSLPLYNYQKRVPPSCSSA